jgi:sporulation protein YlmC with PRC-barrel domain
LKQIKHAYGRLSASARPDLDRLSGPMFLGKENVMQRFLRGTFLSIVGLAVVSALSLSLRADEPRRVGVDVDRDGVQVDVKGKTVVGTTDTNIVRGKDLMGLNVYGENDEKLGDIQDLVIDPTQGKIRYAVLSFGGFLGMGDKYFAVPWSDLTFISKGTTRSGTLKEDHCVLAINKEELKAAPGFDKNNWPNFADRNWNTNVDKYYNEHRHTRKPTGTMR